MSKLVPLGFTGASQLHAERQEGITVDHEAFNKGGIKEKQCTLIRRALPGHKDLQITGRFVLNGAYVLENVVYAGAHQSKLLLEPAQKMVETGKLETDTIFLKSRNGFPVIPLLEPPVI